MTRLPFRCRRLLVAASVLALTACDGDDDPLIPCPRTLSIAAPPALVVEVTDSVTGAARAHEATGTAVTGSTVVPLVPGPQDAVGIPTLFAYGPPGSYTVLVTRAGYAPWAVSGVRVEDGGCRAPQTVNLRARLQPITLEGR